MMPLVALCADEERALLEEHDRADADHQRKGERREPSGEGLRQAELVREETEKEHADRTDERHVEGHTKAHDLAVAEMR